MTAAPRQNCWTCQHDKPSKDRPRAHVCALHEERMTLDRAVVRWTIDNVPPKSKTDMPVKNAPPCPGWAPKRPALYQVPALLLASEDRQSEAERAFPTNRRPGKPIERHDDRERCPACGVEWSEHLGLTGTCKKLQEALADLESASEFIVGGNKHRPVRVEKRIDREGIARWAVRRAGNVLGLDGEWEYEPISSGRDDDSITKYRFSTREAATAAAKNNMRRNP